MGLCFRVACLSLLATGCLAGGPEYRVWRKAEGAASWTDEKYTGELGSEAINRLPAGVRLALRLTSGETTPTRPEAPRLRVRGTTKEFEERSAELTRARADREAELKRIDQAVELQKQLELVAQEDARLEARSQELSGNVRSIQSKMERLELEMRELSAKINRAEDEHFLCKYLAWDCAALAVTDRQKLAEDKKERSEAFKSNAQTYQEVSRVKDLRARAGLRQKSLAQEKLRLHGDLNAPQGERQRLTAELDKNTAEQKALAGFYTADRGAVAFSRRVPACSRRLIYKSTLPSEPVAFGTLAGKPANLDLEGHDLVACLENGRPTVIAAFKPTNQEVAYGVIEYNRRQTISRILINDANDQRLEQHRWEKGPEKQERYVTVFKNEGGAETAVWTEAQ